MIDLPRSERRRYDDPDLERMLVNWQRWRLGDSSERTSVSIASTLNPDRMRGTGGYDRYRETNVPVLLGDANTIEDAINGLPLEFRHAIEIAYIRRPEWTDEQRAEALGYGSRQTYYRRLDDAKVMIRTRIYGQRRDADRARAGYDREHSH